MINEFFCYIITKYVNLYISGNFMKNETITDFDRQTLTVKNESVTVELFFERNENQFEYNNQNSYDKIIELNEVSNWSNELNVVIIFPSKTQKVLIRGIDGCLYLHSAEENENSYSVKLIENLIILSLGYTFFCFDIIEQKIKWKIRPDIAEIFEFYDLQDDFLVRGELEIHRIDKNGKIKWSFAGRDIWVNIEGKKEVQIIDNKIYLIDFENNEYVINFEGQILEDKPKINTLNNTINKLWKF